jgi:hypothetical protein
MDAYHYALFQNEVQLNAERYSGNSPGTLPFPGTRGFDPAVGATVLLPAPEDFLDSLPAGT